MKYSELFHTIQGEGFYTGVPSVFFRTSYCNIRCDFCDTPYTSWKPENKDISVLEAATAICIYNCKHVVITGGEPTIQGKELAELCELLSDKGRYITIETNAVKFVQLKAQFISMSPKLSNSSPDKQNRFYNTHELLRYQPDVIRKYLNGYFCQVKFVVDSEQDMPEIEDMIADVPIPKGVITLMPQGLTREDLVPKQEWLVDICKDKGYRYSPRLHVDIWGNKRGV